MVSGEFPSSRFQRLSLALNLSRILKTYLTRTQKGGLMRNDQDKRRDELDNQKEELSWNDPKHPRYGEHKDKINYDPKLGYQAPANNPWTDASLHSSDRTPARSNPAGSNMDRDQVRQSQGKELKNYRHIKEGPDSTVPGSGRKLSDSILDGAQAAAGQLDAHKAMQGSDPDATIAKPFETQKQAETNLHEEMVKEEKRLRDDE